LKSDSDPRISVVLANYNHARYLPQCLKGMLDQPVLPWEIIAVDDGSTDNSLEILHAFAREHSILRVFANEKNAGVLRTLNRGLELARGDYVVFPAADDELKPGVFAHAVRMLREFPQAGVCSGICEWRSTDSGLTWYGGGGMPKRACYLSPEEMIALGRRGRLVIAGQNAAYKRSALIEAGGWIPEIPWYADWFGAYVVGFRHGMCHVPEVLSVFNLHSTSYYNTARSQGERREVMRRIVQLLESDKYADVAPLIRRSAMLGGFGPPMLRVLLSERKYWKYLSAAAVLQAGHRWAEIAGRRFLPKGLARFCLRVFYGRR
jgi:glycosyltransferase involved in cell wall biosynthesis